MAWTRIDEYYQGLPGTKAGIWGVIWVKSTENDSRS